MRSNGFRVRPRGSTELLRFPASWGFIGDLQFGALGLWAFNRFRLTKSRRRSLSASCSCFLQSLRPDRERDGKKATDNRSTERHAIRACHRTVDGHRPEPAQIVGTAAGLVNAPDLPLAGKDGVVRSILVDAGAEAGRTELKGYQLSEAFFFSRSISPSSSSRCRRNSLRSQRVQYRAIANIRRAHVVEC
jgi:hypothetical protein